MLIVNRGSPQTPTLADYGITQETMDRLALLKLEPQSLPTSASEWSVITFTFTAVTTFFSYVLLCIVITYATLQFSSGTPKLLTFKCNA